MAKISGLDDLEVYQESLLLAQEIYKLTRVSNLSKDYSLLDQIRRAALSVPANIAEGYGRKTKKDFGNFLSIALGSCNEVIAFLDFINLEYKNKVEPIKEKYQILSKRIYSFRRYLLA